jgi:hypothetical protein
VTFRADPPTSDLVRWNLFGSYADIRPVPCYGMNVIAGVWIFGSRFSLRSGGTRDSRPAIYRRLAINMICVPEGGLKLDLGCYEFCAPDRLKVQISTPRAPNSDVPPGLSSQACLMPTSDCPLLRDHIRPVPYRATRDSALRPAPCDIRPVP